MICYIKFLNEGLFYNNISKNGLFNSRSQNGQSWNTLLMAPSSYLEFSFCDFENKIVLINFGFTFYVATYWLPKTAGRNT